MNNHGRTMVTVRNTIGGLQQWMIIRQWENHSIHEFLFYMYGDVTQKIVTRLIGSRSRICASIPLANPYVFPSTHMNTNCKTHSRTCVTLTASDDQDSIDTNDDQTIQAKGIQVYVSAMSIQREFEITRFVYIWKYVYLIKRIDCLLL